MSQWQKKQLPEFTATAHSSVTINAMVTHASYRQAVQTVTSRIKHN